MSGRTQSDDNEEMPFQVPEHTIEHIYGGSSVYESKRQLKAIEREVNSFHPSLVNKLPKWSEVTISFEKGDCLIPSTRPGRFSIVVEPTINNCRVNRNLKSHVDDLVVKSIKRINLVSNLQETFGNLRKHRLKLNPEKCVFGVSSGKLLGFHVSVRGIKANPEKIMAIVQMHPPTMKKEVQKLTGCIAALSYFIARLREK